MRFHVNLLALCLALICVDAQATQDKCPKQNYACLDVINSSQCIEQLVLEHRAPLTKDAMVQCVEYPGTASDLPGATKVSSGYKRNLRSPRNGNIKNVRLINALE